MTSKPSYQLRRTPGDVFSLFYGFCWCALPLAFYVHNGKPNYAKHSEEAKVNYLNLDPSMRLALVTRIGARLAFCASAQHLLLFLTQTQRNFD